MHAGSPSGLLVTRIADAAARRGLPLWIPGVDHDSLRFVLALPGTPRHLASIDEIVEAAVADARALASAGFDYWDNPQAVVDRALRHFNQNNYVYTLEPPLTPGFDSVDQFMFDTRRGFCEHYATAFTILMRAAGLRRHSGEVFDIYGRKVAGRDLVPGVYFVRALKQPGTTKVIVGR